MNRRKKPIIIVLIVLVVLIGVAAIINIINKFTPTKEEADLNQVFGLEEIQDESALAAVVDNETASETSLTYNDNVYLNLETVKSHISDKFYWDSNENILIYTTPTELVKTDVGSGDYYVNNTRNAFGYAVVKTDGDNVYIAADFVKQYTGIEYKLYSKPGRVCITNTWGTFQTAQTKDQASIRVEASIKSPILKNVNKGNKVTVISTSGKWSKVNFEGGFIGYIKNKDLGKTTKEERVTDFKKPEYTSIKKSFPINLVWHQVTNASANNNLVNATADAKGINVISPTWFALADAEGNITSLADKTYVNRAHQLGYEVWALAADFSDADTGEFVSSVLPYTTKRENLINKLISYAIDYKLDGINIDFEYVKEDNGENFIQFLRELSIKCRNNNIVLSVDNYVPSAWSAFYNRQAQGEVADYIIVMAYDEYNNSSEEAGPVASISFVSDGIKNLLEMVDSSKVVLGVPFYTRVWQETPEALAASGSTIIQDSAKGNYSLNSKSYSMSAVNDIVSSKGLAKEWKENLGLNYCEYEEGGSLFRIWLEDEQSLEEKVKLVKENDLAGAAFWKLGLENSDAWNIIVKYVN